MAARPTESEQAAMHERHFQPTANQTTHETTAAKDRSQFASVNHGAPATTAMNRVNGRAFNQQGRIANGMSSGRLTAGESKNLENRESSTNKQVSADRAANDGHLTGQEKSQINQRQNNLNQSIYNDKHNGANAHYGNGEVGQRRKNQQQRLANGIRDGQVNTGQAARDENREQNINRNIRANRQANGGRLTGQERHQVKPPTKWCQQAN